MGLVAHERNVATKSRGVRPRGLGAAELKSRARWAKWWGAACLSGPAQILFSARPLAGAWLLLAIGLFSPSHALSLGLGLVTTTALATYERWNRILLSRGIFGLNGALVGLVWPSLFPLTSWAFWLVIPVSAVTLAVQARLLPPFTRRNLPVLTLPFVLTVWGFVLLWLLLGFLQPPKVIPPSVVGPLAGWGDPLLRQAVWDSAVAVVPGLIALATAAAVASRTLLRTALFGALVGFALALGLGGLEGFFWVGSYAYSAAPVMMAVAGVFFPYRRRSLVVGAVASALSVFVWVGLVWLIFPLGLFPLTLSLNVVLIGVLLFERSRWGKTLMRLQPVPLHEVDAPRRGASASPAFPDRAADAQLSELESLIRRSSKIVVVTGAGVSTESGIPDYRSQVAFWFDANAEDLTYDRFLASPRSQRLYWRLQRRFYSALELAPPNQTHRSLVDLEFCGKLLGIVTQNVDGLHQRAGSSPHKVIELHGNAEDVVCLGCGARSHYVRTFLGGVPPTCERCGGVLKVDVVSIGEPIPQARIRRAWEWCEEADLLLALGSSLAVEPAASLPVAVAARGMPVAIVNRSPTPLDASATLAIQAPLGSTWAELSRRLTRPSPDQRIRPMTRPDFLFLCQVVDSWWGDSVRYLLHPIFLEHFGDSCFVMESDGEVAGFLVGFRSQGKPGEAYVHLVGTSPSHRGRGFGRALYEHFFDFARRHGCHRVSAITVPHNTGSLAFHQRIGFTIRDAGANITGALAVFENYAGPGVDCVVMDRDLT